MIPVITVSQMREIDDKAIGGNLTIGYSYMLKAGMGLLSAARELVQDSRTGEIAIFCGKGNNGGDGYVAGRLLIDAGYKVMCYSLFDVDELKGESRVAFNEFVGRKGNFLVLSDSADLTNLSRYKLIIDAILGTGLHGDPHGLCAATIEKINSSGVPVLAADTPSGLNNNTGIPGNPCIKASVTVTMGYPKVGLYFYPGKRNVGHLIIHDLGYPDEIVAEKKGWLYYPELDDMRRYLPPRHPGGSKIVHGLSFLICGSMGMTGSAALVADAALRTGCGMAHLAAPESIIPILSTKLTETVLHGLHETGSGSLAFTALEQIRELASNKNALCIGPGLSHENQTTRLVREIVKSINLPTVLDADGINAFKGVAEDLKEHKGELIITPHKGEWQRLFGELPEDPHAIIDKLTVKARELNITILLKGNPTIVTDHSGSAFILPFGSSALATAGTGDVLSGIIVSLIAQGASIISAAILGSYIHAEAGIFAGRRLGDYSVLARDVSDNIFRVFRALLECQIPTKAECGSLLKS